MDCCHLLATSFVCQLESIFCNAQRFGLCDDLQTLHYTRDTLWGGTVNVFLGSPFQCQGGRPRGTLCQGGEENCSSCLIRIAIFKSSTRYLCPPPRTNFPCKITHMQLNSTLSLTRRVQEWWWGFLGGVQGYTLPFWFTHRNEKYLFKTQTKCLTLSTLERRELKRPVPASSLAWERILEVHTRSAAWDICQGPVWMASCESRLQNPTILLQHLHCKARSPTHSHPTTPCLVLTTACYKDVCKAKLATALPLCKKG